MNKYKRQQKVYMANRSRFSLGNKYPRVLEENTLYKLRPRNLALLQVISAGFLERSEPSEIDGF